MSNKAVGIVTIAGTVVIGVSTIYAIKSGLKFEDILSRFEENKEALHRLVEKILEFGRDFLLKMYNIIMEVIKNLVIKFNRGVV